VAACAPITSRPEPGAGWLAGSCLLVVAVLAVSARQPPGNWLDRLDRPLSELVAARRGTTAIRAAHMVSALAEPRVAALALAAGGVAARRRPGRARSWQPCLVVLSGVALRRQLSNAIARQRPPEWIWLAEPAGFSMPSRHTVLAALTAGACAGAIGAGPAGRHTAAMLAAATVGASRVWLGVHWPSDVLAGWAFAAAWLELGQPAACALAGKPEDCDGRA
jgi:membrane-associated phospholipid phosphatase